MPNYANLYNDTLHGKVIVQRNVKWDEQVLELWKLLFLKIQFKNSQLKTHLIQMKLSQLSQGKTQVYIHTVLRGGVVVYSFLTFWASSARPFTFSLSPVFRKAGNWS